MRNIIIELATPNEILEAIAIKVKEKQKLMGFSIKTIAHTSGINKKSYENFIYEKKISLINLIKILKTLNMTNELDSLILPLEPKDTNEYKKLAHIREVNQRKIERTKANKIDVSINKNRLQQRLLRKLND